MWHYALLPYLPNNQFRGQLRELVAIMHDWKLKGSTNHLLINRVMEYPQVELTAYANLYDAEHYKRYSKHINEKYIHEFIDFAEGTCGNNPFIGWHNKEYLRVCMCNLYEKHEFGKGKSRITDDEWQKLLDGYKKITGEDYVV